MIIGICGLIGSGKGTVADILVEEHDFKKLSFADSLKDGVAAMFDWPRHLLEGDTEESREWREIPDIFWTEETGKEISPRLVLQLVGTECMRNGFYDGIWVSLAKKKLIRFPNQKWVIPDTRFENEINMIHSIGGKIWRVKRGQDPAWFDTYRDNNIEPIDVHPSEFKWVRSEFDQTIENNSTFEDLKNQILSRL
jgi:hypothetical protein